MCLRRRPRGPTTRGGEDDYSETVSLSRVDDGRTGDRTVREESNWKGLREHGVLQNSEELPTGPLVCRRFLYLFQE